MSFLIFFNSNYSLFIELFYLRPPYMTLIFLNFWLLVVFGVIFDFLKFSKMSFLTLSVSAIRNYSNSWVGQFCPSCPRHTQTKPNHPKPNLTYLHTQYLPTTFIKLTIHDLHDIQSSFKKLENFQKSSMSNNINRGIL